MALVQKQNRYNRINLDGKSRNYTTTSLVDLLPGQVVCLDATEKAILATAALVATGAHLYAVIGQTLAIGEPIKAGDSLTLDYMETGREFALRAPGATVLKRDTLLTVADGQVALVTPGEDAPPVRAYSVENYTVAADKVELVRVRIA